MRSVISKEDLIKSARKATRKAVNKTREAGGAITYQSGKKIIKKHPDGHEEVIETLDRAYVKSSKKSYKIG
jgi:ribosomal protein L32E